MTGHCAVSYGKYRACTEARGQTHRLQRTEERVWRRVAIHAHTYEIARLCAFDYRSTTSLSSIIEAPPPFMIFQPFQRDDVSLIEGLRRLISLYYTGFGGAESIVGVIVATCKAESPGNLATLESLVSMYKGMLTSLNLLRFLYSQ